MSLDNEKMTALLKGVKIISDIFWGPDLQKCHKILSGVYFQPFEILNNELEFNPPDVLQRVKSGLKKFANPESLYLHLETAYVKLFISHREGIAAPLYESCYAGIGPDGTASLMGEPAIRMKRCLEANGLAIDTRLSEPPDHLSIELEYLYFLLEKGLIDSNRAIVAEADSFATKIMLPWVTKFHDRLVAEKKYRFYPHISTILCATLKSIGRLVK